MRADSKWPLAKCHRARLPKSRRPFSPLQAETKIAPFFMPVYPAATRKIRSAALRVYDGIGTPLSGPSTNARGWKTVQPTPLNLYGPDNMLASANMLAPKCPMKNRHNACKTLSCKQMSATHSTVHEMQLLKMQDAGMPCAAGISKFGSGEFHECGDYHINVCKHSL